MPFTSNPSLDRIMKYDATLRRQTVIDGVESGDETTVASIRVTMPYHVPVDSKEREVLGKVFDLFYIYLNYTTNDFVKEKDVILYADGRKFIVKGAFFYNGNGRTGGFLQILAEEDR